MLAFLLFVVMMSFTPGPNTIMAMVSGQQRGFMNSLRLNFGMLFGICTIGIITALFASWFQRTPSFIFIMKVIGSCYLGYLAYHVFTSKPYQSKSDIGNFNTGFLIQITNIKVYLYFVTGLSAFTIHNFLSDISVRWLLMVIIGSIGTFTWTLFGQVISKTYLKYYKYFNAFISMLLIFSIIDLWH